MDTETCNSCGKPFPEVRGVYIVVCDECGFIARYDDRDPEDNPVAWAHMQAKDMSDIGNSHTWRNGEEHQVNWRKVDE